MPIPTISDVSPASGPVRGGNLVVITGTNFRTASEDPPVGYDSTDEQQTISVMFDGQRAPYAAAASATRAHAIVPAWRGSYKLDFPLDVDVRIANLNDEGSEITGENVTKVEAYQLTRPSFSAECYLQRVIRELIKMLRRHLTPNIHLTAAKDYTDDPADHARLRAAAPVYHLVGPRIPESIIDTQRKMEPTDATYPEFFETRPPLWADLEFDVNIYAETPTALFAMCTAFIKEARSVTKLRVPNDPALPDGAYKEYDCWMPQDGVPQPDLAPDIVGLLNAQGGMIVKGVQIDEEAATVLARGWRVTSNDGDPEVELEVL